MPTPSSLQVAASTWSATPCRRSSRPGTSNEPPRVAVGAVPRQRAVTIRISDDAAGRAAARARVPVAAFQARAAQRGHGPRPRGSQPGLRPAAAGRALLRSTGQRPGTLAHRASRDRAASSADGGVRGSALSAGRTPPLHSARQRRSRLAFRRTRTTRRRRHRRPSRAARKVPIAANTSARKVDGTSRSHPDVRQTARMWFPSGRVLDGMSRPEAGARGPVSRSMPRASAIFSALRNQSSVSACVTVGRHVNRRQMLL